MIRIGLIGAGRIGAMHAENLAAHPRFCLTAIYDSNAAAAKAAAEKCGVATAESADAIFDDRSLGAVFVASDTRTHCDYLLRAARANKAALCEKPLDLDIGRVEKCRAELREVANAPPILLGFNRRFDPGHAALIERVGRGDIGDLEKLVITSRDPDIAAAAYIKVSGGLFRDMMIHDFDMARAILPAEPVRVFAAGAALVAPDVCEAADDVDTAMAILQTEGGALCHINCSRRAVYGYDQRVEAFGSGGMLISCNRPADNVESFHAGATSARAPLLNFFIDRYADSYRLQLDAFADAVESGRPPSPSFEDGRRALMLADAAEHSRRSGQWAELHWD